MDNRDNIIKNQYKTLDKIIKDYQKKWLKPYTVDEWLKVCEIVLRVKDNLYRWAGVDTNYYKKWEKRLNAGQNQGALLSEFKERHGPGKLVRSIYEI